MTQREIVDDIPQLLEILPPYLKDVLLSRPDLDALIEVVMDLGRQPEARFANAILYLNNEAISLSDIEYVLNRVGDFGPDNRAGVERTLHRISGIRNRSGEIIGITCRVGRAVFGTLEIIRDVVEADRSVLFLGRPGIGKTTMLREFARVLADDLEKRVVIVDTSNEIAGDGNIPHPAIGRARRMQVPIGVRQADVMIEAVENHMPEVIVIDEIGTEDEADAARTIAERGVRLIGTAHGNTLENLSLNPTLSDLVGGIQAVTLGDEEARKRGTQKTVLERKAPPTFDVLIQIEEKDRLVICHDVAKAVDTMLRGGAPRSEVRRRDPDGQIHVETLEPEHSHSNGAANAKEKFDIHHRRDPERNGDRNRYPRAVRIFPYAVSRNRLDRAIRESRSPAQIVKNLQEADVVVTLKGQYRKMPKRLREAEERGLPIRVVRSNTLHQIQGFLDDFVGGDGLQDAMLEVERAVYQARTELRPVHLSPQSSPIRKSQHELVERHQLHSKSVGSGDERRVVVLPRVAQDVTSEA